MYTVEEIRKDLEESSLKQALFKLTMYAAVNEFGFAHRWAKLELEGYPEEPTKEDEALPWWRHDCTVVWIGHDNKHIGEKYDPVRDSAGVYFGVRDIENQRRSDLPPGEFRIPPPAGKEAEIQFGMIEIAPVYERIREAALSMLMDIDRLERERARPEREVVSLNVVQAILTGFYSATRHLEHRGRKDKKNKAFEIEDEYDVQDLLYAMLRPVVPDLEREDPTRKVAGKGGFLDFRSDELELILEVK